MQQRMHVKMEKINLSILSIVIAYNLSSVWAFDNDMAYCFKFRWIPQVFNHTPERYNCSRNDGFPCIDPPIIEDNYPNTTAIWSNREKNDTALCRLPVGSLCLKYSLLINDKVEKTSSYCGKIIIDGVTSTTPGCYQQNRNGTIVEVCGCESAKGAEPCNASNSISFNFVSLIIPLFTLMYINC
ncbi:uncharacterized protein LOC144472895 isoform X2 [Augochlora pura]